MEAGTDYNKTEVSGQGVLPGFEEIIAVEAAALKNPKYELFAVKFVECGDTARAYQEAIDPDCSRLQAQKNASKLLKTGEIRRSSSYLSN